MSPPSMTPWLRLHIEHLDAGEATLRLSHSLTRDAVTLRLRWPARYGDLRPVVAWIAEVIGKEFPRVPLGRVMSFPVFVSGGQYRSAELSVLIWLLREALTSLPVVLVLADDEFQTKPKALRPPVLIGAMPAYESLLREVEQQSWYLKQEVSRERMMRVVEPGASLGHCQIVVADENDLPQIAKFGDSTQNRLLVVLTGIRPSFALEDMYGLLWRKHLSISCAVMALPWRPDSAEDVRLLVEEIVHNQPLHEAMRNLIDRRFQGERDPFDLPMLFASPATNESLRLSSVAEVVEREVAPLRSAARPADLKGLRARLARRVSPEDLAPLFDLLEQAEQQAEPFRQTRSRALDFSAEGRGMVPMAELVAASGELTQTRKKQAAALSKSIKQGRLADVLEQELERKVDARLLGFTPDGTTYPMTSRDGVAHGQRVRLAVHVGQRGVDSLVIGDTPALDPLLPPLRGQPSHTLKIVVFPKDFRLLSKAMRTVKLPRLGGSAEVTWDLRAPELVEKLPKPGKGGASRGRGAVTQPVAELRFGVYCRNQLLQSFRLSMVLGDAVEDAEPRIQIECDFSQTRNFSSLERLPARAACMGVNEDDAHDTHTLTIVRDGRSAAIQWTEGMMKTFTEAVRKRLLDAASADGGRTSRFTFDSMLKASCTVPGEADKAIRGLADAGRDLFVKLFDRNGAEAGEVLRAIGHAAGETLQFVRHDPDYAFPWPLIYDRKIPEAGRSTLPVCRGGPGCTCGMRPAGYCMNGFWGVRHIIEQLTEAPVPPAGHPIAPAPTAPMLRVLTTVNAPAVQTFLNELKQLPAPCDHQPITPMPDKLLDAVRDAVQRPALLIYLGHMDEVANALQQTSPSLRHPSNAISLMNQDDIVQERLENGEWEVPRSLVLLLGCDTGVTRIESGSSLAASLLRLGASGVLGTECRTVDGLAARMGTEITRALAAGRSIGHAMHGAVNALAAEGCPLGLAFTFLGATQTCLPPHLLTP